MAFFYYFPIHVCIHYITHHLTVVVIKPHCQGMTWQAVRKQHKYITYVYTAFWTQGYQISQQKGSSVSCLHAVWLYSISSFNHLFTFILCPCDNHENTILQNYTLCWPPGNKSYDTAFIQRICKLIEIKNDYSVKL